MPRNLTLDLLKVLLAFMVIGLHAGFLGSINQAGSFLTVNGLFRIAVPIFFVISGYYFTSISTSKLLLAWVKRVLLLYAFWMLFYAYFWFKLESFSLIEVIKLIKNLVVGYFHLWYLAGMLGAGVITFFLRGKVKAGVIISVVCFILGVLIQYAGNYHILPIPILDKLANMNFIHRNFLFLGFPFFYLGFLIKKEDLSSVYSNAQLWFVFILGGGLLLGESWYNYNNPLNDGGFDNYFSLILIVPALFLLVNRSKLTTENKNLALISTAIYLIHPFWLAVLNKLTMMDGTWKTLICITLSFLSSYILIYIQKKIKFIL